MKVIALEEHFADKDLNPACSEAIMKLSPWYSKTMSPGLPYFFDFKMFADTSDKRIADMDEHGITMQVLSCPTETGLVEGEKAIPLVRQANDRLADAVSAHPDRFAGMANLPWSDPEAAAEELGRVVRDLHMSSAVLAGRPQKDARFLDDPAYEPVLAEAEELDVPIYIHPGTPLPAVQDAYYARLDPVVSARLSVFGWGWHNEAGIQAIRMILSGVFERHPKLQIITGHWGELVPYYLARLDQALPPSARTSPSPSARCTRSTSTSRRAASSPTPMSTSRETCSVSTDCCSRSTSPWCPTTMPSRIWRARPSATRSARTSRGGTRRSS